MSTTRSARPEQVELRPGYRISNIIKGGWQLAGDHGTVDRKKAITDMLAFVDAGITTFDCADIYTGVEEMLGEFLKEYARSSANAASDGSEHERVRIHTKYVPDINSLATLTRKEVNAGIERSLSRLGVEQLDLVQFHWWNYAVDRYLNTLGWLADLQREGKIARLGVTNFDAEHLATLSDQTDIVSAQVQFSLLDRRAAGEFSSLCNSRNIHIFAYGSLAGGFLTDHWLGTPDPGHEFENRSLVKYRLVIDEFGGWQAFQALLKELRLIADAHGVNIASVAINATLKHPAVTSVIVGARYAARLQQLLGVLDFSLTDDELQRINTHLSNAPGPAGPVFGLERDLSGVHGRIMKYNLNDGDARQLRESGDNKS